MAVGAPASAGFLGKNPLSPSCTPTMSTPTSTTSPQTDLCRYRCHEAELCGRRASRPAGGRRRPHQGTAYGSMDDGATIIELMNEAGYDRYSGQPRVRLRHGPRKGHHQGSGLPLCLLQLGGPAHRSARPARCQAVPRGGKWIAFVGITTPESFTKSTPAYFMNAKQTKYIYDILGGDDGRNCTTPSRRPSTRPRPWVQTSSSVWAIWALTRPPLPGPVRKSLPTPPALTPSSTATLTPSWRTNRSPMQPARLSP